MSDLSAGIDQSACDKLLTSVDYPLILMERKEDFPGCSSLALASEGAFYRYTDEEVDELFDKCVEEVAGNQSRTDQNVYDQLYACGGEIIQQSKLMLDAVDKDGYEGPSKDELNKIIDGGIQNLGKTMRSFLGDWGLYAWNPYLRLMLRSAPKLQLSAPKVDLDNVDFQIKATGELWAKYPWWNCYKWCLKWKKVIKCNKIGSLTVAIDMTADAHAKIDARGTKVYGRIRIDKLRLNYPILKEIPLEKVADPVISKNELVLYDASGLIATVPVLGSRFAVDSIHLPAKNDGIRVDVTIKEV